MKKFQPNRELYSNFYDSYTSSDEFIAKKRIHTTNEIPPVSIYKNLHSMLQNDFWKWFVGDTEIIYDENYNLNTNGLETFDKNGNIKEMSVAKYTNGIRSLNYGPIPRLVWNKNWKRDFERYQQQIENGEAFDEGKTAEDFKYIIDNSETTYNRFEVTGVLEPEKDLMLHEGYRYLSCVYPDHPDYLNILTKNEFDDKIDDSACLIDYNIDLHFMDWLPQYFKYNPEINKQIAQEDEAAKLKIRNLKNYAFNRKFFGAKEGYKMFAASAFQHASVYSASQYIPLEGGNISGFEEPKNVDITWYKEFFDQPDEFTNSDVDKGHYLYKKLFRNIDWQNTSYDFINRYKEPTPFYGTAYPTPNSRFVLYEYPNERIIDTLDKQESRSVDDLYGTIRADFKEGQKIKVGGQKYYWEKDSYKEGHISYIISESLYKVIAHLNYNNRNRLIESELEEHRIDSAVTVVGVDTPVQPLYKEFDVYPSNEKILQLISGHDNNPELIEHDRDLSIEEKWAIHKSDADVMLPYFESLEMEQPFYNSTITLESIYNNIGEELSRFNEIPEIKRAKLTLDPHQNGCMFIAPHQQISEFEEALNIKLDTSEWFDDHLMEQPVSKIIYGSTNISDKAILKENDYLVSEDKKYISTVLGLSNAYLQFSLTDEGTEYDFINNRVETVNEEETARYGVVFSLSKNNQEAATKKVIVFGKPTFEDVTKADDDIRKYSTKSVYFETKAIPSTKDHAQLRTIYGNRFTTVAAKKYQDIRTLYRDNFDNIEDDFVKTTLNNLKTITTDYNNLDLRVKKTEEAIKNQSIYYNNCSVELFDNLAEKVIDDLTVRPLLKIQARKAYNSFDDSMTDKIINLVKDYRNTCRMQLLSQGNKTKTGFITSRDNYVSTLREAYNTFNDLFVSKYNEFYNTIENLIENGTDLEAVRIKENLDSNYAIVREKLDNLILKIENYTQVYNDTNWTDITSPLNDLLVWFERFKESKEQIREAYTILFDTAKAAEEVYVSECLSYLEEFNSIYYTQYVEYITALDNSEEDVSLEKDAAILKFTKISEDYSLIETDINERRTLTDDVINTLCTDFTDYSNFLVKDFIDIDLSLIDENANASIFKESYNSTLDEFITLEKGARNALSEFVVEYQNWFSEEVAIYYKNIFYTDVINIAAPEEEIINASIDIKACDEVLFNEMLPNKAFLLAPLPKDLLLRNELEGDYSYSLLTDQDEFNYIVSFKKNKYDDLLELEVETIFGKKGLLTNCKSIPMDAWSFGTINTATLAETHFDNDILNYVTEDVALKDDADKNFLGEYYISSKPWLLDYRIEDPQAAELEVKYYKYFDINHDIYELMHNSDAIHKFAYCDPNMLEMFLLDEDKNNLRGEVLNYNRVKINCHTIQDSNIISLEEITSIKKLDYISTGDQVIGKTVDDDTFVKAIDIENHTLTLNKPMQITGEFIFTFLCKIQYEPDDVSEDFYNYRIAASKNKEVSNDSIFEHGAIDTLNYGEISNHMLSSYIDFAVFRESITDALQEQPHYKNKFNLLVRNFYNRYLGTARENDVFVKPSMIETENDAVFELNAYNLLGDDYIMRQEVLDYFYQYLDDMTKASDIIHLGVAVNGYTMNDGKITHRESAFSDDNIHSRFITTEDWNDYEPFYIKIGSGIIPGIFDEKASIDEEDNDEQVGRSLYNEHDDPYGSALYNGSDVLQEDNIERTHYYDIGEPIFKARLGEYEIQKDIIFNDFSSERTFNTIQFSVMKRIIDSFVDNNIVTITNSTISNWNGLQSWPKNCFSVQVDDITYYIIGESGEIANLKDINFLGEWAPRLENDELVFPEQPISDNVLNYYVITNNYDFIVNGENINFKAGQIIIWENNKWNVKTLYAAGFIGDSNSAEKYIVGKFEDEHITVGSNLTISETTDLRSAILYKILNNIGCYTNIASAINYSYTQLLGLYNNALDFFTGKKTEEEAISYSDTIQFDTTCKKYFDENTCYWLQYVGYDNDVSEALYNRNFKAGLFITAIYNIDHFEFTLCDVSQLLFHFDNSEKYISNREYRTLFGINAKANSESLEGENYVDRYPFLINEKIEAISNTIKLRDYENLVPGSYSSMNRVCIPYTAEGFRYLEDGTISTEKEKIFLTEDYIFTDETNKKLYTYNIVAGNPVKFAILQEQNKYFKNIINNIVAYSKEEILTKDGLSQTGVFSPVSGFDFDGAKLSLNDRILSLKPIDVRSAYNLYLEPRLFSKYTTIKGTLKGIIADSDTEERIYGKVLKWNISNEFNVGMKEYLNRVSFASMLNNLRPANKLENKVYQENDLIFDNDSFNGNIIPAPKITKVDVLDKVSTENGVTYYKNNLIIEGTIDESDPTVINFGSTKSIDALNNIQVGDRILEIASLTNGSNTFNQIEANISGIRFIDYRNNRLIICADSGMKVREMTEFSIENVNKIGLSNTQGYVIDGEDLTGSVVPSMLIWDNDLEYWILALKLSNSENGLGMYTISFGDNNEISLTKITEDLEKDNDFNKFQLVNPYLSENILKLNNSENKVLSHKYGNYRMLARDMAIREIDTTIGNKPSRTTVTVEYNQSTDGVITPKSEIREYIDQPRNYIELDCTISNSNENTTLKLKENKAYWLFDNKIGKWIFYQTNKGSEVHIGNQDRGSIKLRLYYVSFNVSRNVGIDQSFETEAWGFKDAADVGNNTLAQGEFLWKLPRPVNEDEIVAVQVETEASYAISKNTDNENNKEYSVVDVYAKISDATISDVSITTKDILTLGTENTESELEALKNKTDFERLPYVTGPYIPYADKTKVIRGCTNSAGYEAVLTGSTIFIKSPTKLWVSDDNKHYIPTSQTEEFFWKRAKLPRLRDISQGDISNMTIDDAYLKVSAMRQFILDDLKTRAPESALYIWLKNNEIEQYSTIDDIPTQISLKDVSYTITSNGIRPTYYITANADGELGPESKFYDKVLHFENYIAAEDIDLSLGYMSKVYLKEQMYLSYLKDFYEIILGCNNVVDLFEEGIKDVRMTDSSLIITSYNNIIMSLPLEKTTSRDDIENMNNWNMLSLNSDYEIPYCDTYSYENTNYIYGDSNNGVINYNYGPKLKTFFAYDLTCSYAKDNIQVYGGTLNLDNHAVEDYVKYIKQYVTNDELDYSWMDKSNTNLFKNKHLFIAYSSDGGRSFSTVDLNKAGIQIPTTGSNVNAIYRIDDVIRVLYNKGDEQIYYYDITIKDDDLTESLIEREYIESDKEYKLMNKNFYIGGGYECLINSPIEQNSFNSNVEDFIISMPGAFAGGSIFSKSATSIRYNPNKSYEADGGTSNVKVLLAIQTSSQIYDQFKYLDYKEDYFNMQGDLRVSESEEVLNASTADRAFSLNETLPLAQESIYSIPSLAVDTSDQGTHKIYKYNTSLKAGSDEITYTPITMTNFEGNDIYLCGLISQEEGKRFLIYRNQTIGNSMTFKEILASYNEQPNIVDNIQRMYAINEDYEFTVNDTTLTEVLNRYATNKNFLLKEIHFANENPHIINITNEDTDADITNIYDDYFLRWPTIDGNLCERLCGSLGLEFEEYDNSNTSFGLKEFLEKLQSLEREVGNLTDALISNYFKPIKVYYNENDFFYGVYETYSSTILMTERVVKETVSMTYEFGSLFNYLDNSILTSTTDLNENGLSMYTAVLDTQYDENFPINAMFINPVGYGSSISNKKWDNKLPQDIDPAAWTDNTLLFNINKEPIFLCDENGNNISIRKGLFYLEKGNTYNISHENLYAEDSIIDIFDGNLIDNKSTLHFYSLPESDIEIWTPSENIDLTEQDITLFRVYRGGVLVGKEDFDENYTIQYSSLYKEDLTPYANLAIVYDGNKISFTDGYNGDAIVENDVLSVTITDKRSGKFATIDLTVGECFKVINNPEVYRSYTKNDAQQVTYIINKNLTKISIPDNNISGSMSKENNNTTLTFTISKFPEKSSIIIYDDQGHSENLKLDIAELSPVLYTDRDWSGGELTTELINCKVYSKDVDITDKYIITKTDNLIKAVCIESPLSILTKDISTFETTIKIGDIDYNNKFIYSYGETNTLTINRQKDFLVRGLYGQVILLAPKFKNYKELISSLGRMIDSDVDEIYNIDTVDEKVIITDITTSAIHINRLLNTDAPYLRIKLLPVSSITLSSDVMNNENYYTEISIDDIDFYGYDRVCINENVFMAPPLKVNNQYFNTDSVAQYTVEPWKNKDGNPVYLTDINGKYVKGFISNHKLNYKVIGDEFGNCSQEVYQSVNPRLNPTELIYKTAYDYYYNTYYSISKKSNPFFRFLKINQNIINENIIDEIGLYQQRKENNVIVLKKDEDFKVINKILLDLDLNKTYQLEDIVDEKNGELNYIITCEPSTKEYSYLAGIKYKNYMYDSDIVSDKKYCMVDSNLIAKFAILSKEDLTNTEYKPIVNITEMGIFSKEGYLLAYMHHPIVQYNTKLNHISYNLIIENT